MLVARTGLSPVMVGRTAELSRLQSLVGASRSPAVALIAGEAGIGKTRLARELIDSVEPATVILAGQADPGTVGRPMELFLDSLRSTNLDAHPELSAVVSDVSQPAEDRVRAGVDLVRLLTSGCTSLVVFEDLHWADSESLTLFERLAEPDGGRLLVVGTYRPDGLSRRHPAGDLLTRLERRHGPIGLCRPNPNATPSASPASSMSCRRSTTPPSPASKMPPPISSNSRSTIFPTTPPTSCSSPTR